MRSPLTLYSFESSEMYQVYSFIRILFEGFGKDIFINTRRLINEIVIFKYFDMPESSSKRNG